MNELPLCMGPKSVYIEVTGVRQKINYLNSLDLFFIMFKIKYLHKSSPTENYTHKKSKATITFMYKIGIVCFALL